MDESFFRPKATISNFVDGDRNIKFQASIKKKKKEQKAIIKFKDDSNHWLTTTEVIASNYITYFA